jgi:hypothetical protein
MAVSLELATFCGDWRAKANEYDDDLRGAFDKFFTLYVVFNRLYAEATFRLARRGQVKIGKDRFPDSKGSQEYVLQFCKATRLVDAWRKHPRVNEALQQIAGHLRAGQFALKLDIATGVRILASDQELLKAMESRSRNKQAKAGLEALYAIRCNMFHGHKGFNPIQLELLRPAIVLLETTIEVLQQALDEDNG